MPISRRNILIGAGATAALTTLPGCARTMRGRANADAEAQRLLTGIAEELLAEFPENATVLGLDKDARAGLKSRLSDRSLSGALKHASAAADRLRRLHAVDAAALSPATRTDVAVLRAAHELALEGHRFPYGDVVVLNQQCSYRNSPYVVAQNTGAFIEIPDFLDSNHAVVTAADAEAYLARLEAYGGALDGETARLRRNAELGVIAPSFLLDKTLKQMKEARAVPVGKWGLVTSLARRTAPIPGDYAARVERLVAQKVAPALDRQIAELSRHRARATDAAGVWKLPQSDAYYAWALRAATTSALTPYQVHQRGLDELNVLQARMDTLLRAQGLTKGTVGERMTAIGKDPRHLFPNND
ncbi:MAG TPA: DUF885 family protein, partial [Allosphingosinicella sp.]|nr:DUF885 family protein [Allosphingosinicella sp.]